MGPRDPYGPQGPMFEMGSSMPFQKGLTFLYLKQFGVSGTLDYGDTQTDRHFTPLFLAPAALRFQDSRFNDLGFQDSGFQNSRIPGLQDYRIQGNRIQ